MKHGWNPDPCPPEAVLPHVIAVNVMRDPRRFDENGHKFSLLDIAAVYADRHHEAVDKKLRPLIWRLIKENSRLDYPDDVD